MKNLFTYGTLMWLEELESVMGRRLAGEPALLADLHRQSVISINPACFLLIGSRRKGL
ncbi:gamma-glutamylcyclotransferase family protein [Pontiella sulfatireligans]|uniref:hypothetical protein n=1 Tax=Pontiella sulfatireligans TaxID=2750658 RepID=UPI001444439B|nr:hypothetical protein [Pontiella sulfatireligans]